jgi:hypothetical protein
MSKKNENYSSLGVDRNKLGFFEKIEKQKRLRDDNVEEAYFYMENQPKNVKSLILTANGYKEGYYNDCPKEKRKKDVWVGIL